MEGAYEADNLTDLGGKIVGFEPDLALDLCARIKVECKMTARTGTASSRAESRQV